MGYCCVRPERQRTFSLSWRISFHGGGACFSGTTASILVAFMVKAAERAPGGSAHLVGRFVYAHRRRVFYAWVLHAKAVGFTVGLVRVVFGNFVLRLAMEHLLRDDGRFGHISGTRAHQRGSRFCRVPFNLSCPPPSKAPFLFEHTL